MVKELNVLQLLKKKNKCCSKKKFCLRLLSWFQFEMATAKDWLGKYLWRSNWNNEWSNFHTGFKKIVICCEKSFFSHLCTDDWQITFYGKANQDCLEEHFIVCNFQCTNLFDETTNKPVDAFDLCLNCRRHLLSAISINFHRLF